MAFGEHLRHLLAQHADHGERQRVDHRHRYAHASSDGRRLGPDESGADHDRPTTLGERVTKPERVREAAHDLAAGQTDAQ